MRHGDTGNDMNGRPILVVDLDFTLIKTDMLLESMWAALSRNVASIGTIIGGLLAGKAQLKARLAARADIDPALLPYNENILQFIRDWREKGGRAALVTASDRKFADSVAGHLGLFDAVHASDGTRNLKGVAKAELLVGEYGDGGFDYIADGRADIPVWQTARRAITVDASPSLRRAVENVAPDVRHLENDRSDRGGWLRAIRPHQWLKNILVFVPLVAAHATDPEIWFAAFMAFVAFCLVASSAYVLNDLLDLAADRAHPRKRERPFASGEVTLLKGSAMAPGLLLAGLMAGLAVDGVWFMAVLAGYYALTVMYSLSLKRKLVIDVCALAGLYTLRILAGGFATGLALSVWLLAFSIFFFLSLAAAKRVAELADGAINNRFTASGRAYLVSDLPIVSMMALSSGYIAVLVLSLYIDSDKVQQLYPAPELLWGICPVLLYWVSRMVMMAHRGNIKDDPILYAMRDWISMVCGVVVGGILVVGLFL